MHRRIDISAMHFVTQMGEANRCRDPDVSGSDNCDSARERERVSSAAVPRVLLVRGHRVNEWELRPWTLLPSRFEVRCLLTSSNRFTPPEGLTYVRARALRDLFPRNVLGEIATLALGDRFLSGEAAFEWADIVHAADLSLWFSAEATPDAENATVSAWSKPFGRRCRC